MNNLIFGAHLHGVELIMSHSIVQQKRENENKNLAAAPTSTWGEKKWKQTCNQTYVAPSSICVLSLCRGRFYPHIGPRSILFYFCAWFVKMFYFYLNENLIKKLHYRWNMQTNIRFPFFSGSFFRFCVCFFLYFSPKIRVALRSPLCAHTHNARNAS